MRNKVDRLILNQRMIWTISSNCVNLLHRESRSSEGCSVEMTGTWSLSNTHHSSSTNFPLDSFAFTFDPFATTEPYSSLSLFFKFLSFLPFSQFPLPITWYDHYISNSFYRFSIFNFSMCNTITFLNFDNPSFFPNFFH